MDDIFFGDEYYAPLSAAFEVNNTFATASTITEGTHTITGSGADYYQFEAQAGPIELTMDPTGTLQTMNMELRNASNQTIATGFTPTGAETISHTLSAAGTYYVRIYSAQFGDTPPAGTALNYDFTLDLPQVVAPDGNNSLGTASALSEGSHDILGREEDWHQLSATAGYMTLNMTAIELLDDPADARDNVRDLNLELRNSAGQVVSTNFSGAPSEDITYLIPEDGTYYARVYTAQFGSNAPDGTLLSYNLDVDYATPLTNDGNDSRATASTLGEGTHTISGTGQDWHRIDSPSGLLSLAMTPTNATWPDGSPVNLNMELRDSNGNSLQSNFTGTGSETIDYVLDSDGSYFVRIYRADIPNGVENSPLEYTLDIDLPEAGTSDGNDTQQTAEVLPEGTSTHTGTGVDWYRFDTLSGLMNFSMTQTGQTPTGGEMNLNMELFTAAGDSVRQNFSGSDVESFSFLAGEDATYFLKVYWAPFPDGAPNGVEMSYSLSLDLPEANAAELNDVFATAPTLTEGTSNHTGTGVDWYRFDTLSGLINYSMTQSSTPSAGSGDSEPLNLNVELFTSAGVSVSQNFSDSNTESASFLAGVDDTYFLKVYWAPFPDGAPNGVEMSYSLNLDLPDADTPDGNDTRATASVLGSGSIAVDNGTGVDWYRIETGPGIMDFTLRHDAGGLGADGQVMDLNMELYDQLGEVIRGEFLEFSDETFSFLAPQTETYFLKVYWAPFEDDAPNGFNLDYELELDLPINTWSQKLDFGPIRNASVTTYDIDNDGKDEIFIGTSKGLDSDANEVLPAGLIVLEDDGTVKWTLSFPAFAGPDPATQKTYNTTSVTTAPVFSDVNGDGTIDIVVGVGADNRNEFAPAGQPGDMGGLYAVDATGQILWSHINQDSFGSPEDGPDGRPDGTYRAPRVFDIDADGVREVIFASWDHNLYVLNGKTGETERVVDLHDTAGATPAVADLNRDGLFELVVPADITDNLAAGLPDQGGILHVLSNYGQANVTGWTDQVADSTEADFRGKFEEQSLWSSPQIVDLNRDGVVEIVQGTGNFFQDERGQFVKVWNADGTLRHQLNTVGRVLAAPLIADLDGDGSSEIIAATLEGNIHAWTAGGTELFTTKVQPFNDNSQSGVADDLPIVRHPIAVDIDNADGDLEILLNIGSQLIILDSDGTQITNTTQAERAFGTYAGSPVAKDIDGDGILDLITGGTNEAHDQAIVYRWENVIDSAQSEYRTASYQSSQSLHDIQAFVERLYSTILNRSSDPAGNNDWTDELYAGVLSGADVAHGFINSREFTNRGTSDAEYVDILYAAFFGRDADAGGFNGWMTQLQAGAGRSDVLDGFVGSREFINLANSYGIRAQAQFGAASNAATITGDATDTNVLRGGAGNNILYDEGTGVAEARAGEKNTAGQIYRLYGATLARTPDANGFLSWFNGLSTEQAAGGVTLEQAAGGFTGSREFSNTYGDLSNTEFVELLYQNVLNRNADTGGLTSWLSVLEGGESRANVVLGFSESREYQNNTNAGLDSFMRNVRPEWVDVLEGGAGDDQMNGGTGSDVFIFRNGQGGNDTIHGFEPWDELQLSGFGFNSGAEARARMTQNGANVVFNHSGQAITFLDTTMAEMTRVKYNVS